MRWALTNRVDARVRALADRHYSRKTPGAEQFAPPGWVVVLVTPDGSAGWVSLRQRAEFVDHQWPGAWLCSLFRNERPDRDLSSELITEALAATRAEWGEPSAQGVVTFVDPERVRAKRDPGRCFRRAGFREVARIAPSHGRGPRVVLQLGAAQCPAAAPAVGAQLPLEAR